ncbi:MAG: hypothetical protein KF716_13295 [Anaerolineae bacterium]|nr:hypothetical protein [Anaerolineae bacterium]
MLGTYGIIRKMLKNWESPSAHPAYKYFRNRIDLPFPIMSTVIREIAKRRRWLWVLAGVIVVWMLAQVMLRAQWQQFISTTCMAVLIVPVVVAILVIYFLPAAVAVLTSAIIVAERERQTWDILLTATSNWDELVLARLARLLRYINPFREIVPGVYFMLGGLACIFAIVTFADKRSGVLGEILEWVVIFLVPLQYLIERIQDFVLASLIGLVASLIAPSRQVAAMLALCAMLALLVVRAIFIISLIGLLPPPQALSRILVLMITGPASAIAMTMPVVETILGLLLLPLINEVIIRLMFSWLIGHLGEGRLRP